MVFGKQIKLGFRTYFSAIGFIFSKGLWWAFFFPLVLNTLLFLVGYKLMESFTTDLQNRIIGLLGLQGEEFFLSEYLTGFLSGVIWVLLNVLFFFLFAYYGGYITLILLSPLFAYLSERTEEIISGKIYPFSPVQFVRDIVRGVLIALRNLLIETGWVIVLFVVGFIPVIGWVGVIVLFIISAYFYGFSFIDYSSERRKMKISRSVEFVRTYKWLAVANGSIFCFFLFIPFCGVFFSGFAAIIAVVAATLSVNEFSPVK